VSSTNLRSSAILGPMETPISVPDDPDPDPDDAALIDRINVAVELIGVDESTEAAVAAGRRTIRAVEGM
jgi:hypothetical protein